MQLGSWKIFLLSDGMQRLDGGAMFGVVPKVFWEKKFPADERNRIRLALNCLLIQTGEKNILVDTGIGDKESEKFCDIYGVEHGRGGLTESLARVGLRHEDVDTVVNTHLHFDHAGGNTRRDADGNVVPAFPKARYVSQRGEYEDALRAHERNRGSYLPHNYVPIKKAGMFSFVEGRSELLEGLEVIPLPGHCRHMQGVLVCREGEKLFFPGDLMPTSAHAPLPWIMAYDLNPEQTLFTRKDIYARAISEKWLWVLDHDPKWPFGRLEGSAEKPVYVPVPFAPGDYVTPFE